LAAALDVVLHELLGVLFEDLVDLVDEAVHLFFELLALLGHLLLAAGVRCGLVAGLAAALLGLLCLFARGHGLLPPTFPLRRSDFAPARTPWDWRSASPPRARACL